MSFPKWQWPLVYIFYLIMSFFFEGKDHVLICFVFWTQGLIIHEFLLNFIACPWIEARLLHMLLYLRLFIGLCKAFK